jgi:glycosyltransferase involved in cell wall biosynthesis
MASVAAQQGVRVRHVVVGDRCPDLADPEVRAGLASRFPTALVCNVTAADDPLLPLDYLPARLAYLRNLGATWGGGDFVAQLDDDNTFDPDHLRSLVQSLAERPDAGAAYSWRKLWYPDGAPFVPDGEDPWHPDPARRARSYQELAAHGMFEPGSNVVRDTLLAPDGRLVARVDTSEFLVRREVFARVPFPEQFSPARRKLEITEDVAFCHALYRRRVPVVASRRASLNYYMGGYSNRAVPGQLLPGGQAGH